MERYLVFDAACSICDRLAQTIQEAVGDRLQAISVYDAKARDLLDQAFPAGWEHAPYLVTVRQDRVDAHTGFGGALRLAQLMGPRRAWRVWSLVRRSGVVLPPGGRIPQPAAFARRQFLKISAASSAALAVLGVRAAPASAAVCECENGSTCCSNLPTYCDCRCPLCPPMGPLEDHVHPKDCYDTVCCLTFCGRTYEIHCCAAECATCA